MEVTGATQASTFVAVADAAADDDAKGRRAPQPLQERRALERRLRDAALTAVIAHAPLLLAALASSIAGVFATFDASPLRDAWAGALALVAVAWAWLGRLPAPARSALRAVPRRRRGFVALGVALLLGAAALPWLPGAGQQPSFAVAVLLLGALSVAAAAVFAPTPEALPVALALPWSAAVAERFGLASMPASVTEATLAALAISVIAGATAAALHRAWRVRARRAIEMEDRVLELKAARDAAERADEEKSRFLAVASHDLRQPVHALGLFVATLEKRLHGTAEEPLVRNIVRSIDGLDRLFNAMLDISRLDTGTIEPNLQPFPLRDVFRRLHMQFAGQAEMAGLSLRFSPGGKSVVSDPQLLERVIGNLIQNGLKYTERGGIVVVARTTARHVNVEVWDTGVGIREEELPRVFDEFYQVRGRERAVLQGLGMGLAIVKRLVRLLGHRLTVVSRPGRGTLFRLSIVRGSLGDVQDVIAAADTLPMAATEPRVVLIIDDEEAIRQGLALLLAEWGYDVMTAASLEQAVGVLARHDVPPDLILSDLHLGDGPDGLDTIDAVRRACGLEVPAILVTGDTSNEELQRATDSGHPVLVKPVQPRKLLHALRGLLA